MNVSRAETKRRDFMKLCGLAGLGVAAPVGLRQVRGLSGEELPPYDGPYYVVFNAAGGWDTTYLMDPKGVNGLNRLYKEGDILTHGKHKYAPTEKHIVTANGMSNETFLKRYGDELFVFNGIDYSVNNHSPCQRYMATGKLDSLAYPTFAALVAACKGPDCPIAFLTFGNYSNTGDLVPMSRLPYISSLTALSNASAWHGGKHLYHEDFVTDRIEEALKKHNDAHQLNNDKHLSRTQRAQSTLYAAQLNSKALQRVQPYIPKSTPKNRLSQQTEIALASFKAGVCVSANLHLGGFDSHANNDADQMKLLPQLLEAIDHLCRRAEQLKIRDKLVIVMQSEMGRTPNYNKGNGKDHWSIGSIMFMAPGSSGSQKIKGNRVSGATDDKQFLVPVNPKSLAIDKDKGIRVRPEHIHTALREFAGIESHPFSKRYAFDVKDEERLEGFWG